MTYLRLLAIELITYMNLIVQTIIIYTDRSKPNCLVVISSLGSRIADKADINMKSKARVNKTKARVPSKRN